MDTLADTLVNYPSYPGPMGWALAVIGLLAVLGAVGVVAWRTWTGRS